MKWEEKRAAVMYEREAEAENNLNSFHELNFGFQ